MSQNNPGEYLKYLETIDRQLEAETVNADLQVQTLNRLNRMMERELQEDFSRDDFAYDEEPGAVASSTALIQERTNGDNSPVWTNEHQWRDIVLQGRKCRLTNLFAENIIDSVRNYVIGTGFKFFVSMKDKKKIDEVADLDKIVNDLFEEWSEENDFLGLQTSSFEQTKGDGEFMMNYHYDANHFCVLDIDPLWVKTPNITQELVDESGFDPDRQTFNYGIQTFRRCSSLPKGFFVAPPGETPFYLHSSEVDYLKINVDRSVKRGYTKFYRVAPLLDLCYKIARNMGISASVISSFAMISKDISPGDKTKTVSDITNARTELSGKPQALKPGIVAHLKNQELLPMDAGNQNAHIEILKTLLRIASSIESMPDAMATGDASSVNYASALVNESPFVKSSEFHQEVFGSYFKRTVKRFNDWLQSSGRIQTPNGTKWSDFLKIECQAPPVAVRDKMKEIDIDEKKINLGIISRRTVAEKNGEDFDDQQDNIQRDEEKYPHLQQTQQPAASSPFAAMPDSQFNTPGEKREYESMIVDAWKDWPCQNLADE